MTEHAPPPTLLLRSCDAARALAISERSLWSLTAPCGPIPCVRLGRSVRYAPEDLAEFIASRKTGER